MARRDPEAGSLFLIDAAFADSTNKKYIAAASAFSLWLTQRELDPESPDGFDRVLTIYFHHLYRTGQGKSKAPAHSTASSPSCLNSDSTSPSLV